MKFLDLSKYDHWMAIAITGLIDAPIIPLGAGPDMYILSERHFKNAKRDDFSLALKESFEDFGLEASEKLTLNDPKLILVPLTDVSEEIVSDALKIADMALACFNQIYFPSRARFIKWERRSGKAIGVTCTKGAVSAIRSGFNLTGPAIVKPVEYNFWDWFLASSLRGQLPELGKALYKNMEWERESQNSSHITHRFAFNWVGLESMMPNGECQEAAMVRRYSLVMGAPRGADSKSILANPEQARFFEKYKNSHSKQWVRAIEGMYRYRCAIFHDGSSDLNSEDIDSKKIDWYYHLSKTLSTRVNRLAVNALIDKVDTIDDFWNSYVIDYLYSERNHWATNGTFMQDLLINFDWENEKYPEVI
ncbi:hypothetical protein P3W43_06495 [Salinicola salarius]|uniref:hypothetical protein n=1 Tax=Salinicola salarius TaxID=430457 RepID=UPI0023E3E21C|nr:hypothetical protein [Salinicola salarius]MDF3918502.1 hypothetical protein [Salinicola salarius]